MQSAFACLGFLVCVETALGAILDVWARGVRQLPPRQKLTWRLLFWCLAKLCARTSVAAICGRKDAMVKASSSGSPWQRNHLPATYRSYYMLLLSHQLKPSPGCMLNFTQLQNAPERSSRSKAIQLR